MRALALVSILISLSVSAQNFKELTLTTKIEDVTVFLHGAQITRVGHTEIQAGKTILKIKSLSPYIDERSIQVSASGDFTVLSVNHDFDYINEQRRDAKVDSLRNKMQLLANQINVKNARLLVLSEKQSVLDANKHLSTTNEESSLMKLKQALEFYDRELSKIRTEEIEVNLAVEKIKAEKKRIEQQLTGVLNRIETPTGQIEIRINSLNKTKGEFKISYLVANAGWYPNYDIRVLDVESPLTLRYKADVYQNTGTNWENVKLKFSNADPNQSGVAPVLSTWNLNYVRNTTYGYKNNDFINNSIRVVSGIITSEEDGMPIPGVNVVVKGSTIGTVSNMEGRYQLTLPNSAKYLVYSFIGLASQELPISSSEINVQMESDVSELSEIVVTGFGVSKRRGRVAETQANPALRKANMIKTEAIENQTTVEFEVTEPYTIRSNNSKLTIDLREYEIETIYEYYSVPKLQKDAFLMARIINWDQYNLLEGEANLFFEDSYVGRSVLNTKSLSDTLDISLGKDRSVVISREKNEEFSKRKSVGLNKVESRSFDIIAKNNKAQSIKLTIFDQLPKAAISDISITPTEISGGSIDEETNKITWALQLAPQEKVELKMRYEVKYPKKERVILE